MVSALLLPRRSRRSEIECEKRKQTDERRQQQEHNLVYTECEETIEIFLYLTPALVPCGADGMPVLAAGAKWTLLVLLEWKFPINLLIFVLSIRKKQGNMESLYHLFDSNYLFMGWEERVGIQKLNRMMKFGDDDVDNKWRMIDRKSSSASFYAFEFLNAGWQIFFTRHLTGLSLLLSKQ